MQLSDKVEGRKNSTKSFVLTRSSICYPKIGWNIKSLAGGGGFYVYLVPVGGSNPEGLYPRATYLLGPFWPSLYLT